MKYKDWLKRQTLPPDAHPIYCPDCGEYIGDEKDFMFMVLTSPVVCPKCDEIVIFPTVVTYTSIDPNIQNSTDQNTIL